jgi:FecR protein
MYRYRWTPALLLMVLFAMRSTAANAEPAIGVAASIKPNAESVVGETSQTLSAGNELRANETVRTGNRGQADLVFIDNTNLTVGPTSEVLLDKFVYDPTGSSGKVVLNATRGTFRFITGTQDHRVYAVKTPYGTLGVRGTVVEMRILHPMVRKVPGECVATVKLVSGAGFTMTTSTGVHEITEVGGCGCVTRDGHWKVLDPAACPALFAEAAPSNPTITTGGGGCTQVTKNQPCQ